MQVRIFQPPKNAMQSGRYRSDRWLVEFEPETARQVEPLMGWTSSADTKAQLRLWFDSKDEAVAYAQRKGYMYTLEQPHDRKVASKAYADNFGYKRAGRWTH